MTSDELLTAALDVFTREPASEKSWEDLYRVMRPFITAFLVRTKHLDAEQAAEISAATLIKFVEVVLKKHSEERDRKARVEFLNHMSAAPAEFRSWMITIANNALIDWIRDTSRESYMDSATLDNRPATKDEQRAVEDHILAKEYAKLVPQFFKRLLQGAKTNRDAEVLYEMARENGCKNDVAAFIWLKSVLLRTTHLSDSSERQALIDEFRKRQRLSLNAAYVRLLRLRQIVKRIESEIFS